MAKRRAAWRIAAMAALLLILPGLCRAERPPAFRCLAVGMDRFVTQESTSPCSVRNAEIMGSLFREFLPFGAEVTVCTEGLPSVAALEERLREAFREAEAADYSILYLSTHGVCWEAEETDDPALQPEKKERTALLLSDGSAEDALSPEALDIMLAQVPGKKVLILDACYSGAFADTLGSGEIQVLASSGAGEQSYFWAAGEDSGTGYFTSALDSALRASGREQIDPDGDDRVSPEELAARLREIYGVAVLRCCPEGNAEPLFFLPEDRHAGAALRDLRFDPISVSGGQVTVSFRFFAAERTKLEYRLIPAGESGWDFTQAVRLPDRERTGRVRGLLTPGEKERQLRFSADTAGAGGQVLLQILALRGGGIVPECTRVVSLRSAEEEIPE